MEAGIYAGGDNSEFLKFAILWISFVSFLNTKYPVAKGEGGRLSSFKESNKYKKSYKSLLSSDQSFTSLIKGFDDTKEPKREFVENLQTRKEKDRDYFGGQYIEDFSRFIEVVYQIRCNFFHGDKIPYNKEDLKLVKWAYESFLYFWKDLMSKL